MNGTRCACTHIIMKAGVKMKVKWKWNESGTENAINGQQTEEREAIGALHESTNIYEMVKRAPLLIWRMDTPTKVTNHVIKCSSMSISNESRHSTINRRNTEICHAYFNTNKRNNKVSTTRTIHIRTQPKYKKQRKKWMRIEKKEFKHSVDQWVNQWINQYVNQFVNE